MDIRQGADPVYSHSETYHVMLELGETLDSSGIQKMIDRMISYRVLNQGSVALEHLRLPHGERIHPGILRDTKMGID